MVLLIDSVGFARAEKAGACGRWGVECVRTASRYEDHSRRFRLFHARLRGYM